jgi:hypothetical protein
MAIHSHLIKIEIYGLKIKKNIFYEKCTIILDLNPESIITNDIKNVFKFTFIKNIHINIDIDPHGEDNWGNYNIFNIKQKIKSDNEIKDIIDNL